MSIVRYWRPTFDIFPKYGINAYRVTFEHDNDPKYTTKPMKEWLSKQPSNVLKWHGESPELTL